MDEAEESLLETQRERTNARTHSKRRHLHTIRQHPCVAIYIFLLHVMILILLFKDVFSALSKAGREPFIIFPELRSLRHVLKVVHATNHSEYSRFSGPPSASNAAAWEHLLQPLYFNASEAELLAAGSSPATAVKVKNGGYIAALGAYHEIHCLNRLRYFLYSRHDAENMTREEEDMVTDHLDHCIEVLRISVMCTGDLSLYTFTWPENPKAKFLDAHSTSPRKCVDWDQLESYAWKRKVGLAPTLIKDVEDKVGNQS
ncbi:uncharacterized protein EI97DRAFT_432118 [Westerdykella ornata]|uniref:Tat pathway signal sequence n=1 Tax=Westerdykella ornata TaxID=318751 RepID=A0A6A6JP42_WESOR|nr:uncharacterized protein EI97DRAFT_432118 [Westerdykella ornata]KAF2278034.1 hypothetical protein EI97DRAFT_432118 [Westerdykella ornata]